ncbi:MAG: Nucleolar protein 16 [Bathelium mastoideum]|nr:MAG: Nucleolar protein 16 [Bathelium mastoideum]KAI9693601.1 MAG: Nucleolar protein 16 [Bathelium mastoideum]
MGRVRQKRKNRSSLPKIRQRRKSNRPIIPHPEIAQEWNHKETVSMNYARLGLSAKLNQVSGGSEKHKSSRTSGLDHTRDTTFNIKSRQPTELVPSEARVERDPKTGKILRITDQGQSQKLNPLNDPLNEVEDRESEDVSGLDAGSAGVDTRLVQQLKHRASLGERKNKRKQSAREAAWVEALVNKHGDDYDKMVWDKQLNPMQQSMGDIKRRVQHWRESQA